MLDSQFIHQIQVLRWKLIGQDGFGNASQASSYIPSSSSTPNAWNGYLPCRVENYNAVTQYRDSGERAKNATIIYSPLTNPVLMLQDEVYWKGETIGRISGVNPAVKGTTDELDHYEYIIENP